MAQPGGAKGSLTLRFTGFVQADDILKYHPEIKAQLDDIITRGWKYLYIQLVATAVTDMELENSPCRMRGGGVFGTRGMQLPLLLEITVGVEPPKLKDVPEVKEFRINVCSKSFPRAATIDLAKGVVTYLHDPFWKWEKGWEADTKKLSDAREVYEIAEWLMGTKKFELADPLSPTRYQELADQFKALPQ
jgi:hypothetical protein